MMRKSSTAGSLFITIFTLTLLAALFTSGESSIATAGISETLKEMQDFIKELQKIYEGWKTFFERLGAVTSAIGLSTILLFFAILFISSGLSAIGVPRGIFSFFLALFFSDTVWIIFKSSFTPESYDYLWPIAVTNLKICIPLLLLYGGRFLYKKLKVHLKYRDKEATPEETAEALLAGSLELYRALKETPGDRSIAARSEELSKILSKLK